MSTMNRPSIKLQNFEEVYSSESANLSQEVSHVFIFFSNKNITVIKFTEFIRSLILHVFYNFSYFTVCTFAYNLSHLFIVCHMQLTSMELNHLWFFSDNLTVSLFALQKILCSLHTLLVVYFIRCPLMLMFLFLVEDTSIISHGIYSVNMQPLMNLVGKLVKIW